MTQYDNKTVTEDDKQQDRELITKSPQGDVTYDPEALKEARQAMHAGGHGDRDADPMGGHDPEALREAAERMNTDQG